MSKRGKEWRKRVRAKALRRGGGCCVYCGVALTPQTMTLDHVLPKSRGGDSREGNLVAACKRCNHIKGNRSDAELGAGFWKTEGAA